MKGEYSVSEKADRTVRLHRFDLGVCVSETFVCQT